MKLTDSLKTSGIDEIKAALAGGKLIVYSVAQPSSPDKPVQRSGVLATFTFAAPAFSAETPALPVFASNPVAATGLGVPGFARAYKADGSTVVADFSAGPGATDIKFSEVSTTPNYPIKVTTFTLDAPAQ